MLVTGAGGFIGASVVRALFAEGAHVVAAIRPGSRPWRLAGLDGRIEIVPLDVRAPDGIVANVRPELAVGCAAVGGHPQSVEQRLEQLEVSVLGTTRLVAALAGAGCERFVHLGGSIEYGPSSRPMRETDRLAPVVPRGGAKAAETLACLTIARSLELPVVVLRPFAVYGPLEPDARLVPSALRAAREGVALPLVEPGIVRDFVYVGDVAGAVVLALTGGAALDQAVVNVGTGVQTTVEALVATVGRVLGREVEVVPGAYALRAHDARTWVADVTLAEELLGWRATTSLEEGLRLTAAALDPSAEPERHGPP